MENHKLNQVLEQLAALGQQPSDQVLLGLAAASGHTYEQVLEIFNSLQRRARTANGEAPKRVT